jgi:hypothetical protein
MMADISWLPSSTSGVHHTGFGRKDIEIGLKAWKFHLAR